MTSPMIIAVFYSILLHHFVNADLFGPEVTTSLGVLRGTYKWHGLTRVKVFHSVPFAEKPINDLRFKPPVPKKPWKTTDEEFTLEKQKQNGTASTSIFNNGVLDVSAEPSPCSQMKFWAFLKLGREDCLYTQIYVPEVKESEKPLPVLFYLYGGGYALGDSWQEGFYDGVQLAATQKVIVVVPNYRVDIFGFLAHEILMQESQTTGNYGIQDQRLALKFVQKEIQNFGGNPNAVTIFGESAGAFSVCTHLASPGSKGLFHAAIMESGTCDAPQFFFPLKNATSFGDYFTSRMGCNATALANNTNTNSSTTGGGGKSDNNGTAAFLNCLRTKSTDDLMDSMLSWIDGKYPSKIREEVYENILKLFEGNRSTILKNYPIPLPPLAPIMPWGPTIDGNALDGLIDVPINVLARGEGNYVPLIIGSNHDEGTIFLPMMPLIVPGVIYPFISDEELQKTINHFYGSADGQAIYNYYRKLFPHTQGVDEFAVNLNMGAIALRDRTFLCESYRVASIMNRFNKGQSYVYQFAYKEHWLEYPFLGDFHGSEIQFVWGIDWVPFNWFNANDRKLADQVQTYWGNMAKYANPNGAGTGSEKSDLLVHWPSYNNFTNQSLMQFGHPLSITDGLIQDRCSFWRRVEKWDNTGKR